MQDQKSGSTAQCGTRRPESVSPQDQRIAGIASKPLITQRSSVQIRPPQPMITGALGSSRSALRVFGCGGVAGGYLRRVVQLVHCLSICSRHQVPIDIDGELDRSVPKLVPHVGKRLAVLNEQGRDHRRWGGESATMNSRARQRNRARGLRIPRNISPGARLAVDPSLPFTYLAVRWVHTAELTRLRASCISRASRGITLRQESKSLQSRCPCPRQAPANVYRNVPSLTDTYIH